MEYFQIYHMVTDLLPKQAHTRPLSIGCRQAEVRHQARHSLCQQLHASSFLAPDPLPLLLKMRGQGWVHTHLGTYATSNICRWGQVHQAPCVSKSAVSAHHLVSVQGLKQGQDDLAATGQLYLVQY